MSVLFLIRGLPGSGKSTLGKILLDQYQMVDVKLEADDFFYDEEGNYNFDPSRLQEAHRECLERTEEALSRDDHVAVCNTFTTEKELKPYLDLAEHYEAAVISLIVENRHGKKSIHNVPEKTMDKMGQRFSVKLR